MTGEELYMELTFIDHKWIEEANTQQMQSRFFRPQRMAVIAAAAALMVFLLGCAVVSLLRLSDVQIQRGESAILTFSGISGTPEYHAAQEWQRVLDAHPDYGTDWENLIPGYEAYHADSPEMAAELERIAGEYGLKLLDAPTKFTSSEKLYEALGINSIFRPNCPGHLNIEGCTAYGSGNFHLSFTIPQKQGNRESKSVNGRLVFNRTGYLSTDIFAPKSAPDWQEWNYQNAGGEEMLLLLSSEYAAIFCTRESCLISVVLETSRKPNLDKLLLEQIADSLDFSIQPSF